MSTAIAFAIASLLFAAANDIIFKRFALRPRSRGAYLAGIGIVWSVLQQAWHLLGGVEQHWSAAAVGYGVAAGLLVSIANLALIESLSSLPVSLGATIYRLNTIAVVLFAVAFLGEALPALKLLGIAAGVVAVLLLGAESGGFRSVHLPAWGLALAVAASLLRAGFALVSKAGVSDGVDGATLLQVAAAMFVPVGLAYAHFRERGRSFARERPLYPIVSGTVIFLIASTLVAAMERADATVVVPIANLSFAGTLLISAAMGMERLTARKSVAVALAAASLWLLSQAAGG